MVSRCSYPHDTFGQVLSVYLDVLVWLSLVAYVFTVIYLKSQNLQSLVVFVVVVESLKTFFVVLRYCNSIVDFEKVHLLTSRVGLGHGPWTGNTTAGTGGPGSGRGRAPDHSASSTTDEIDSSGETGTSRGGVSPLLSTAITELSVSETPLPLSTTRARL